jgi:hypothetical protein
MEIKFSPLETGACPICRNFKSCRILEKIEKACLEEAEEKFDTVLEAVIYRCPEFEEK